MPISVEHEFRLPRSRTGIAFSADAARVLGGTEGWSGLQQAILASLLRLSEAHGRDGVAWLCALPSDDEDQGRPRLGLVIHWDGTIGDRDAETLLESLRATGIRWAPEGTRVIPRTSFPTVALREGFPYQLWLQGRRGLTAPTFIWEDDELLQEMAEESGEGSLSMRVPRLTTI